MNTKRIVSLALAVLMLLGTLGGCVQPEEPGTQPPATTQPPTQPDDYSDIPDGYNQLVIYWDRCEDLDKAAFWIWTDTIGGQGYPVEADPYGCKMVVNLPDTETRAGFIACYGCSATSGSSWIGGTKDVDSDRFVDMDGRRVTIYLRSGDANIYSTSEGGSEGVVKNLKAATIVDFETIEYTLSAPAELTEQTLFRVRQGDREIPVTGVSSLGSKASTGRITLGEKLDLTKNYVLEIEELGTRTAIPTDVFDCQEFINHYTYDGDDLGAVINGSATTFKVWAPTASAVVLNLFAEGSGGSAVAQIPMVQGEKGVWSHTQPDCGHGVYYTYTVTTSVGTQEATDPYAKAAGVNGNRSMVVALDTTDPDGWDADQVITTESYTDAVIWEIHVRDFSNRITSSRYPGKYLAFTERGLVNEAGVSVGVDYLVELGITHVQLLPVYDYATVDESNPDASFNWGYDPKNYNVPEGSYSTDPEHGEVRIREFKQMVQALHEAGIGVVMDVVYNHTYEGNASFNRIVPYYYYRFNADGTNTSASGCGNDTASERYMYSKFMVDSVTYWASEYHLDGFRFDLMGLHDLKTMSKVEKAVHTVNSSALLYGEGWTMGSTVDGSAQANQTQIGQIRPQDGAAGSVAVFNDAIRDGLKGSVFDAAGQGYINGDAVSNVEKIMFSIDGGSGSGTGWTVPGAAVINYMSAHDNNTLWDKLALANSDASVEQRLAMNRLGATIVMIAKGTPFWQAGEEMLRSKPDGAGGYDENSYKSSDTVNNLRWEDLTPDSDGYAMMRYYQGLIAMRSEFDIFRGTEDVTITFTELGRGALAALFRQEDGTQALVLLNPGKNEIRYNLEGEWNMVCDGTRAGTEILATETGRISIPAYSARVYVNLPNAQ